MAAGTASRDYLRHIPRKMRDDDNMRNDDNTRTYTIYQTSLKINIFKPKINCYQNLFLMSVLRSRSACMYVCVYHNSKHGLLDVHLHKCPDQSKPCYFMSAFSSSARARACVRACVCVCVSTCYFLLI